MSDTVAFHRHGDGWRLERDDLPPGLYRLEVAIPGGGPWAPPPIHELFAVAG